MRIQSSGGTRDPRRPVPSARSSMRPQRPAARYRISRIKSSYAIPSAAACKTEIAVAFGEARQRVDLHQAGISFGIQPNVSAGNVQRAEQRVRPSGQVLELAVKLRIDDGRADVVGCALLPDADGLGLLTVDVGRDGAAAIELQDGEAVEAVLFIPFRVTTTERCIPATEHAHGEFPTGEECLDESGLVVALDDQVAPAHAARPRR